ncbi:hypothetical protein A9Q88_00920 [Gammaproteobacteria bacterium 50_400_T64]|nr:hypothetical protein A9Q88_00920 [Gammaproteobacteria bacterium 50_400_T64]
MEEWVVDETEESEDQEQDVFSYQINSYPADITLKGYLDKWDEGQIEIPEFQRSYVWDQVKASKLIESFLLGLPVPGVFLYKDRKSNKLAVIDGQQRILSAIRFFKNEFDEKIFRLKNVLPKWEGKTYTDLEDSDRFQLNDTVLRATVVQQLDPEDDSSIYHIFERLNTGGINLNPMEIRKCVYFGELFALLEELNGDENWRKMIFKPKMDKRLRDVELVLRCLSLHESWKEYDKPMKGYLNGFMAKIKKMDTNKRDAKLNELREIFTNTCEIIANQLPEKPFHLRGRINYAAMDSIFNAVAELGDNGNLVTGYQLLVTDPDFLETATINTSDGKTLYLRFQRTLDIFAG